MRYRTISQEAAVANWSGVITEATGIKNANKLEWMSTMLQITENAIVQEAGGAINEHYGLQGPEAVPGMGAVKWPGVGTDHGDIMAQNYAKGSGDMPSRQLAFAMNVAAYTIGLELLPVIPMEFPSLMFGYLDTVYAGNLDEKQAEQGSTEIYLQLTGDLSGKVGGSYSGLVAGDKVVVALIPDDATKVLPNTATETLYGTYLGQHRINGDAIVRFEGGVDITGSGATGASRFYNVSAVKDVAPSKLVKKDAPAGFKWALVKGVTGSTTEEVISAANVSVADRLIDSKAVKADLVSAVDMHIPEFSKASPKNPADSDNYTNDRARGEKGTQNIVSLRLFSTSVEAGEIQVLGELTRTQLKDLSAYGQDGMGQLYKAAQNELTQTINADILRTQFRLGVTTAVKLRSAQKVDLNLYIGNPATDSSKALSAFGVSEFADVHGVNRLTEFPAVRNAETNSSAENNFTRSRRILTKILAASNIISNIGRHGAGDFVVTNMQVATAIQDIKGFTPNPFDNDVTLDKKSLYCIGTVQGGIKIYVDPNMKWNDTRVLVGRKGEENEPGLKMFIYTLGDSVETTASKSMAPKILVSSRYTLTPCGFFPEAQYITFAVNNDFGLV
jgi:hypothetical protein